MHELGRFPDARHTKTHVFSLCGKSRPSEPFWDTRPVGTCHPVFIFHSAETGVANAVGEPESQGSGQLRKARVSLWSQQTAGSPVLATARQMCLQEADPPKSTASSLKWANTAPEASWVLLPQ